MSVLEELKRLDEARETGAISDATYKKLRQQITDLVEDANVVTSAPKPPPPKPSPARPRAAYVAATSRYRKETAKQGEIVAEDQEAVAGEAPPDQPQDDPAPRNLWRDAALAGLVVISGILTAGWLLGDVILALTIVLALLALALIPITRRLIEEDQAKEERAEGDRAETNPMPQDQEPQET